MTAPRLPSQPTAAFPATHRLRHKTQFDRLYRSGKRVGDSCFLLVWQPNTLDHPRLGLAIAAKTVGNAVNRNRVKRVIRDSFRRHQSQLPCFDVVVSARSAARSAPNSTLAHRLQQLWAKLASYA